VTKMFRITALSSIFLSILNTVPMYLYSVRSQRYTLDSTLVFML
jgi:hypothetical protein